MDDDQTRKMGAGAFLVVYTVLDGALLVLLGQRNGQTVSYPRWLELAGGTVEAGEAWRAGLTRELEEETGIRTTPDAIVPFALYLRPDQPDAQMSAGLLRVADLGIRTSKEWIGYLWADTRQVEQLQDMLLPGHLRILEDVLQHLGHPIAAQPRRTTAWALAERYIGAADRVGAETGGGRA